MTGKASMRANMIFVLLSDQIFKPEATIPRNHQPFLYGFEIECFCHEPLNLSFCRKKSIRYFRGDTRFDIDRSMPSGPRLSPPTHP